MTQSDVRCAIRSPDAIHDALRAHRRRLVLHYLSDASGTVSLDALETRIREREDERDGESGTNDGERAVSATLHHVHLSRLADSDVVDYDWRSKTVRYRPDDLLESYPNRAARRDLK